MTDEEFEPDYEAYSSYVSVLDERELSNIQSYDKSILTVSSAGIALSIVLLQLMVTELGVELSYIWMIKSSWACFLIAIGLTIVSFQIANKSIDEARSMAERFYLKGEHGARNEKNFWANVNVCSSWLSGGSLLIAMILIIIFAFQNINISKDLMMSGTNLVLDGAGAPAMKLTEGVVKHGAGAPKPPPSSKPTTSEKGK
jgi:hypothetical protein